MANIDGDQIDIANKKGFGQFISDYLSTDTEWQLWSHPRTNASYLITLQTSTLLSKTDFNDCFNLISTTSLEDYKNSKNGWNPRSKRKEMELLDLKYFLVRNDAGKVEGFCSFMPTYEDDYPVIYCYEIHLSPDLQGSGLGKVLMSYLDTIGSKIPGTEKVMLTCFTSNVNGLAFYKKLGFEVDEYSPGPKILRNGTRIESDYVILSKGVTR